jgi:hypothetical protein
VSVFPAFTCAKTAVVPTRKARMIRRIFFIQKHLTG